MAQPTTTHPVAPQPPPAASAPRQSTILLGILLAAVCILPLLSPGNTPFAGDEAGLMTLALDANASHRPAARGLLGTHGVHYGPTAIWIYQSILIITHHPPAIALARAALFTFGTATALLYLASTLRWWRPFALLLILSPYFYYFARIPWDNSFGIPIGAWLIAIYVSFLYRPSGWKIAATIIGCTLLLMLHLMAAPLVAAIAVHALLRWRDLLRCRWWIAGAAAVALAISFPYFRVIAAEWPGQPPGTPHRSGGLLLLADAGRNFSAIGVDRLFSPQWLGQLITSRNPAVLVTGLVYLEVFAGMLLAIWRANPLKELEQAGPATQALLLFWLAPLLQAAIFLHQGILPYLHYNHATWICYAMLAWFAADAAVTRLGAARYVLLLQMLCLAGVTVMVAARLITDGYGWPVARQMEAVQAMASLPEGKTVALATPGGDYDRPQFETLARLMDVRKPAWAKRHAADYMLICDPPEQFSQRLVLVPRSATTRPQ